MKIMVLLSNLDLTGALCICGGLAVFGIIYLICRILDKKRIDK